MLNPSDLTENERDAYEERAAEQSGERPARREDIL